MSIQIINVSTPNDGLGDSLRASQIKANENFAELNSKKVEKIAGKDLSMNDFTNELRNKLNGIQAGAKVNVQSDWLQEDDQADNFIKNKPVGQFLQAFGTLHYSNSLAVQNAVSNVELKLLNNGLGANTNLNNAPFGVGSIWNTTTNQFDFTSLEVGDYIEIRPDLDINLIGTNTSYSLYAKMAIGDVNSWTLNICNGERKSADVFNTAPYIGFDISNEATKNFPAEIYILTDANATVKVNGWLIAITRKSVNIIDIQGGDEYIANKQNNLTPDGTGVKYPTVDAVKAETDYLNLGVDRLKAEVRALDYRLNTDNRILVIPEPGYEYDEPTRTFTFYANWNYIVNGADVYSIETILTLPELVNQAERTDLIYLDIDGEFKLLTGIGNNTPILPFDAVKVFNVFLNQGFITNDEPVISTIGNNFNTFREITLSDLGVTNFTQVTDVLVQNYINSLNIIQLAGETNYFKIIEPLPNFDVTGDWVDNGVTDKASFRTFLTTGNNTLSNVVITDFNLVNGRLTCDLSADGTELYLNGLGITEYNNCGVVNGLECLDLSDNQITTLVGAEFPIGLNILGLNDNLITTLVGAEFPTSLQDFDLTSNQFTTSSYTASEPWANALTPFTNPCVFYFTGNPNSPIGTNFQTILATKNATVQY